MVPRALSKLNSWRKTQPPAFQPPEAGNGSSDRGKKELYLENVLTLKQLKNYDISEVTFLPPHHILVNVFVTKNTLKRISYTIDIHIRVFNKYMMGEHNGYI